MGRRALRQTLVFTLVLAATLSALSTASASAGTFAPPKGKVLTGVSDHGTTQAFESFQRLVGKHPALLNTFHTWGFKLNKAYERWRATKTRPILSISTRKGKDKELFTPQQIALGADDEYLLELNEFFSSHGLTAYIRPLGEPNRCKNPWSAVDCSGKPKGGEHTTGWYKQAFRRIATLVRGGDTIDGVNTVLAGIGLPPVKSTTVPIPVSLPPAPVAIIWNPLPHGSPAVKGNYPGDYWPGDRWVDWVGADFYADQTFAELNYFFERPYWKALPFALTEWGVAKMHFHPFTEKKGAKFAEDTIAWTLKRPRVRMLVYYDGVSADEKEFNLANYPSSAAAIRRLLRAPQFLAFAEPNAGSLPPLSP